ncbi:hypothetical protein JOM56_011401 [Amanita muscaria]
MSQFDTRKMAQHFGLPSELWFKVIAFVLSDCIYSLCCSATGGADLSWERNALRTLRMVSKSFSHTAFKVADLALAGRRIRIDGVTPVDGEEHKPIITDVDGDERIDDLDKLKLIYNRFKMINDIHSENVFDFVSQSGVTILSAYYGYVQVIKNCKTLFWRQGLLSDHPNLATNWFASASQQHLAFVEKIHGVFPTAIKNILSMLDILTVPEMVEKLRRDMGWYSRFIASGLEIVYRCAQVINRRDEWQSRNVSKLCAQGSCSGRVSNYLGAAGS